MKAIVRLLLVTDELSLVPETVATVTSSMCKVPARSSPMGGRQTRLFATLGS